MSAIQCPKCELRFTWRTELDDHCLHDHPDFHHDYPIGWTHPDAAHQPPPPWRPDTVERL